MAYAYRNQKGNVDYSKDEPTENQVATTGTSISGEVEELTEKEKKRQERLNQKMYGGNYNPETASDEMTKEEKREARLNQKMYGGNYNPKTDSEE